MFDLYCPYCDSELSVCHDDGFGYKEGVKHQMECSDCAKSFVFETSISFHYKPEKADCLNNGKHQWMAQTTYPKEFTKMECKSCGDTRHPSPEEMEEILNPKSEIENGAS